MSYRYSALDWLSIQSCCHCYATTKIFTFLSFLFQQYPFHNPNTIFCLQTDLIEYQASMKQTNAIVTSLRNFYESDDLTLHSI